VSDVQVRRATAKDAATIAVFNLRMAQETEQLQLDPTRVERGVRAVFDDPARGTYFVADLGGVVVGCLLVTREWSDWRDGDMWWIQSVYVHDDARRRGVFKAMHAHVRAAAVDAGVVALRLYVERHNDRAKATYASLGMQLTEYDVMHESL
jgi:ribosomal protein S18 acetylase RimI-like enzyme